MIKHITAGYGIQIINNSSSGPYINMSAPSAGMVRYNGSNFEIYDGSGWMTMTSGHPQIELDSQIRLTLEWAREKMQEEQRLKELAIKSPTVADALEAFNKAKNQLKAVAILCETGNER